MRRIKSFTAASAILIAVVGVAACSSSSGNGNAGPGPSTSSGATITVDGIAFPKPELTNLTIGHTGNGIAEIPDFNIVSEHLDQKFGMNITFQRLSGDAPLAQALVAGQFQVIDGTNQHFLTQETSVPSQIVFTYSTKLTDVLFTKKGIATAADLKGKSVAVSSIGALSYGEVLLCLQSLGLTANDVTFKTVGNDSARLAALKAGSVDAAILGADEEPDLVAAGYNPIADLGKISNIGYDNGSLIIPKSFQEKYPNTTLALVAMVQMGTQDYLKNETDDQAAQVIATATGATLEDAKSQVAIARAAGWSPVDGRCQSDMLKFQQSLLEIATPALKDVDPASTCTDTWIDKLQSMGFQKALGVQGY